MSRPERAAGMAAAWIGNGSLTPWSARREERSAETPRSVNVTGKKELQYGWRPMALRGDGPDRPPLRCARDRPGRRRGSSRRGVAAKGKRGRNPGTARRPEADDHP